MMMTLYHGSDVCVETPLAKAGRKNLDFGRGFYLTKLRNQAEAWASIIATRKSKETSGIVSVYHFNREKAIAEGIVFKIFENYDMEWLEYVINCRKGKDVYSAYDVVEGGVANDNVIDTVEDFEKGIITAEQALGQLQYKKINHQLCILKQVVIDRYVTFVKSITLK